MNFTPAVTRVSSPYWQSPQPLQAENSGAEWSPVSALRFLAYRWRAVGAVMLACAAIAWLVQSYLPRSYTAETLVLLDPRNQPALPVNPALAVFAANDQTINSEMLIVRSPELAATVIAELQLTSDPAFASTIDRKTAPAELAARVEALLIAFGLISSPTPPAIPAEAALEARAGTVLSAFGERLEVAREGRSNAIRISFAAAEPELAAKVVNKLAATYLDGQQEAKLTADTIANTWLDQRVGELRAGVEAAERAAEEYRAEHGLADSNGVTITGQQIGEINSQLIAARANSAAANARLNQARRLVGREGDALSAGEVLSSPLIHRLKEQEVEVLRQRADLSQEFGARHPRMLGVEAELSDIRGKIAAEVRQIVAGLRNEAAVARAQEQTLAQNLAQLEQKAAGQSQAQVRLRALEREAEASRGVLETFLGRFEETANQAIVHRPDGRVISRASPPQDASSPRPVLIVGSAALVSGVLMSLAIVCLGAMRTGPRSPGEVERQFNTPVLGLLPDRWHSADASGAKAVYAAENLRMIAGGVGSVRSLAVCAPVAQPGLDILPLALAGIWADAGHEVLLIRLTGETGEGNAGGNLHQNWNAATPPSLEEFLAGIAASTIFGGMDPAGRRGRVTEMPNPGALIDPSSLLEVDRFAAVLSKCCARFDRVVVDAGALLATHPARVGAGAADATIIPFRWARTPPAQVSEACSAVRAMGGHVAGFAMTGVDLGELAWLEDGSRRLPQRRLPRTQHAPTWPPQRKAA